MKYLLRLILLFAVDKFYSPIGVAQREANPGVALRTTARETLSGSAGNNSIMPLIFACVCLILIGLFVVTLWPKGDEDNALQRQRKFARVDRLFLKLKVKILNSEESKNFSLGVRESGEYSPITTSFVEQAALVSLSFGGCSLVLNQQFEKGTIIILDLGKLPDFPSKELPMALKVVWCHSEGTETTGGTYSLGGKFLFPNETNAPELLRQYLNFLLEEPLT